MEQDFSRLAWQLQKAPDVYRSHSQLLLSILFSVSTDSIGQSAADGWIETARHNYSLSGSNSQPSTSLKEWPCSDYNRTENSTELQHYVWYQEDIKKKKNPFQIKSTEYKFVTSIQL